MSDIIFIESGRKRKGEACVCEQCGSEFIRRKVETRANGKKQKYCSIKCSGLSQRNRVEVKCHECSKEFERPLNKVVNSKNGFYFCSRECKDKAQRVEGSCPEIQPEHYKDGSSAYRELMKEELKIGCKCGIKIPALLKIHHKDGNRKNREKDNLEVVCINCHAIRHLRFSERLNEWILDYKYITPVYVVDSMMKEIKGAHVPRAGEFGLHPDWEGSIPSASTNGVGRLMVRQETVDL